MSTILYLFLLTICLSVVALAVTISTYNRLKGLRLAVHKAWREIDQVRFQRHDVVEELIEMATIPMQHTQDVLDLLAQARMAAVAAVGIDEIMEREKRLTEAVSELRAVVKLKPPRYSKEELEIVLTTLKTIEEELAAARAIYNEYVARLNRTLRAFPGTTVGPWFGFQELTFFHFSQADEPQLPSIADG